MKFPLRLLSVFAMGLVGLLAIAQATGPAAAQELSPGSGPESKSISPANPINTVMIPGPLRSFLRMAGVSQEVNSSEVLPMVARNLFVHGFDNGKETEFLLLLSRYLQLARALLAMASNDGVIRVGNCASATQLVQTLGYRFENGCSSNGATLVAEDSERAFLAVDSGFPITKLEESLQRGEEFAYPFPATMVPVLFDPNEWIQLSAGKGTPRGDVLDVLLHDENVDRLYSAMARLETGTREELHRSPGLRRLLPYGPILDFYAGQFSVTNGDVNLPGGPVAEGAWQSLVGVSPHSPGEFLLRMVARDRGWLAAYYDAVARISPGQQVPLLSGNRLRMLYDAYRSTGITAGAGAGVFPRNADLLLLLSRIPWDASEQPDVPGNLQAWQQIFAHDFKSQNNHDWVRHAQSVSNNEQFLEDIVSAANLVSDDGPSQMYLAISAIDSRRPTGKQLSLDTLNLLSSRYYDYHDWYLVFADFPQIDDGSIAEFMKVADHIGSIGTPPLKANALGAFQADLGIWQIFARQGQISEEELNASWLSTLEPFAKVDSSNALFEAARTALTAASVAAGGNPTPSEDTLVDLLAGPTQKNSDGARVHEELAGRMHAVMDDQRLASLDTLFGLYDGLQDVAKGTGDAQSLLPLAENLHDFEMPRPIFTEGERAAWSPLIYTSRHAELQVQTDLTKTLKSKPTAQQLEQLRTRLAPFLRDTLVGLNYAYYEPPGAQVLHNNPLFVRSHDFSVASVQGIERVWGPPELIGVGATAGGGAYLMGSLADLPYALASTEEDFIAPEKVQALIWRETVPQLLVESVIPRWWNVSKTEMHAAALYQRAGEELLTAARDNAQLRGKVVTILADRFTPSRLESAEDSLSHPDNHELVSSKMLPADLFFLAARFRTRYPDEASQWGPASQELSNIAHQDAQSCEPARIAADFGAPHPAFTETDTSSLLSREPFPVSGGYSSRLFGESWESSNLYWARLADEMGYSPVMLNILAPELTRHMISKIFATYVDDWPALLRALDQTGDEFRKGKFAVQSASRDGAKGEIAIGSASE